MQISALLTLTLTPQVASFISHQSSYAFPLQTLRAAPTLSDGNFPRVRKAIIEGYVSPTELPTIMAALQRAGFDTSPVNDASNDNQPAIRYSFVKATGMLKLMDPPGSQDIPTWIPIVSDMENVLVENGWSFLDPDSSEAMSAFDVDAANKEGQYIPKWGQDKQERSEEALSDIGFALLPLSKARIQEESATLVDDLPRRVLLEGATDPHNRKITQNGHSFSGSKSEWPDEGIFVCAIGGLPLFTTHDLAPTTASSGWLSFSQPVSSQHIEHVKPDPNSMDQRVEVVCARTKCHLGHYFGPGEGYCINASAMNYYSAKNVDFWGSSIAASFLPTSFRSLEFSNTKNPSPSSKLLQQVTNDVAHSMAQTVVLGAGCFWHIEFALRRLPGVVATECGYCGGSLRQPSYEQVCEGQTGHAEVVKVTFLPNTLPPRVLLECFLAMHDPTKSRAHGKHALGSGQYRSCVFVENREMLEVAQQVLRDGQAQLNRDLSTEVGVVSAENGGYWSAESRHQRHKERRLFADQNPSIQELTEVCGTLSTSEWLHQYGKRSKSVLGSAETLNLTSG